MAELPEEALVFFRAMGAKGGSARVPKGPVAKLDPEARKAAMAVLRQRRWGKPRSTKTTKSKAQDEKTLAVDKGLVA